MAPKNEILREFLISDAAKGLTGPQIASLFGGTRQRVSQLQQELGIEPFLTKRKTDREEAVYMLHHEGYGREEIAALLEIPYSSVIRICKELKLKRHLKRDVHGTLACYNAGCSCRACRAANALRMREYHAKKKAQTH